MKGCKLAALDGTTMDLLGSWDRLSLIVRVNSHLLLPLVQPFPLAILVR
jgi:hypothetical protein